MKTSPYSLRKSQKIFKLAYDCYKKKAKTLSAEHLTQIENDLQELEAAIHSKDRDKADQLAHKVESLVNLHCKKTAFDYFKELFFALLIALIIATLVRQVWFELYEIPTGSMRPTFKEKDHLLVSKTTFGINWPLRTEHFYFDPQLVQRTSVVIFSGDGIPLDDTDTTYFGIFPYKKRYIKRMIGKPGDLLYFYGGKIYGIDKDGNDLTETFSNPWMEKLDHVPFISFEGRVSPNLAKKGSGNVLEKELLQMYLPLGRVTLSRAGEIKGEIFDGKQWIKDEPFASPAEQKKLHTYFDFWGMENYAKARLLTKDEVKKFSGVDPSELEEGILYLELRHHPNLTNPQPRFVNDENLTVVLTPFVTVIPLQQHHLDAIMGAMYTARFVVEDGYAHRYSAENHFYGPGVTPAFPGVPNGTYEFYHGVASKILWGGMTEALPKDSPLYSHDPKNIERLFNVGIDMLSFYEPRYPNQIPMPTRYAYFRDEDLYVLGAPIIKKDDTTLKNFIVREEIRVQQSSPRRPYVAFKDNGPPLKKGKIDRELLETFGLRVPEKHYLVLGDNYAMSSDSRYFGFIPEENLQGAPSWILWPPGSRWGSPSQKPYPWLTVPNGIIWSVVVLILAIWWVVYRWGERGSAFKKISR